MPTSHMKQVKLSVEGISCNHCVTAIKNALTDIGVDAEVDLANNSVMVHYDERNVSLDKIKEEIEEQGYTVR